MAKAKAKIEVSEAMRHRATKALEADPEADAVFPKARITLEVRLKVEGLLLRCISIHAIRRLCREQYGLGPKAVDKIIAKIYANWNEEDAKTKSVRRVRQVKRLYRELDRAVEDRKHVAVIGFERLIAEIEGNREPERVQVAAYHAHAAIGDLIAAYTDEQVKELALQQHLIETRALLAERAGIGVQLTAEAVAGAPSS